MKLLDKEWIQKRLLPTASGVISEDQRLTFSLYDGRFLRYELKTSFGEPQLLVDVSVTVDGSNYVRVVANAEPSAEVLRRLSLTAARVRQAARARDAEAATEIVGLLGCD